VAERPPAADEERQRAIETVSAVCAREPRQFAAAHRNLRGSDCLGDEARIADPQAPRRGIRAISDDRRGLPARGIGPIEQLVFGEAVGCQLPQPLPLGFIRVPVAAVAL